MSVTGTLRFIRKGYTPTADTHRMPDWPDPLLRLSLRIARCLCEMLFRANSRQTWMASFFWPRFATKKKWISYGRSYAVITHPLPKKRTRPLLCIAKGQRQNKGTGATTGMTGIETQTQILRLHLRRFQGTPCSRRCPSEVQEMVETMAAWRRRRLYVGKLGW